MKLQEAFAAWASITSTAPDGSCCGRSHTTIIDLYIDRPDGRRVVTGYKTVELPDSQVCAREKAWRKYITLRDGRSHHVYALPSGRITK